MIDRVVFGFVLFPWIVVDAISDLMCFDMINWVQHERTERIQKWIKYLDFQDEKRSPKY